MDNKYTSQEMDNKYTDQKMDNKISNTTINSNKIPDQMVNNGYIDKTMENKIIYEYEGIDIYPQNKNTGEYQLLLIAYVILLFYISYLIKKYKDNL